MDNPNDTLPSTFFTAPGDRNTTATVTSTELRNLLFYNEGRISACGKLWDIRHKYLGVSVYRVWLKEWKGNP